MGESWYIGHSGTESLFLDAILITHVDSCKCGAYMYMYTCKSIESNRHVSETKTNTAHNVAMYNKNIMSKKDILPNS